MAGGGSPGLSGRRRGRNRAPPTPSPPPLAQESNPLPPGTEIEVRIDDEGFYGSWYEATVVGFAPAAGRRRPARYTVTYSHLVSVDGPDSVAPSHVRPRPPPAPPAPPPFLLHDIVEAFGCNGWWPGIVVAPALADPVSPVTVAFPITREVLPYPPNLVRPRRDFIGGEWVPSRAVVAVPAPKRGVRVYKAGERVQLLKEREAYGDSWFPATVTKAVDRLSYIVEYMDDQEGEGKVEVYRHWGYIRPAEYHCPRQSKVRLCPGAAVEVFCDRAWSQGVLRRVVREGCEYEVSVGEEAELLLTKAVYQVRPLFVWNGRHWTIPTDKRQANSRQQSVSEKRARSPVDATSSDEEHSSHPKSSTAKKSRTEPQQQELISDEGSEHASVSEMAASLFQSCNSLPSNHCLNSWLPLSEKNDLSVFPHEIMTACSLSKNGLLSASSVSSEPPKACNSFPNLCPPLSEKNGLSGLPQNGHLCASSEILAPPKASDHSPNLCPLLSENNDLSVFPHEIMTVCSVSKNEFLSASLGHSEPPEASNSSPNLCPLSEKNGLSGLPHKIVNACSVSKNGLLRASSENLAPPTASNHSPNLCPPLSAKNGLSVLPEKILSTCSVSKNGPLCASTGCAAPPVASNNSLDLCPPLSENSGLSLLAHKTVSPCSMSKNGLLCTSSGNSAPPPDEAGPNVILETECNQDALSQTVPSHGQLNTPICGRNVAEAFDMLSISEAREQNIAPSENLAPPKASNHSPNLCPLLSAKNGLSLLPEKILSTCSVSKNGPPCASTGYTSPPVASNNSLDLCPPLSENSGLSLLAHKTVSPCSMSKNGLLFTSSGNSASPPDESLPNVICEIECSRNAVSETVPSHGQLNAPICGRNVDEACDMLSISEAREQNIASSLRNQQTQERPFSVKAFSVKKGISKSKKGETLPKAHQGKNDASNHVQIQLKGNMNSSGKEIICASSASPECEKSSAWTPQVSKGTSSSSDSEGVNFKKLARKEGTGLLDKELAALVNTICQMDRDEDVCTDTAATQVTKSNPLTEIPITTLDDLVQQDGSKVDETSILIPLQNAGSSEFTTDNILLRSCSFSESSTPSDLPFSQISGYKVPFVKSTPAWSLIDAMDVYKKVPQQPHFRPLRKVLPTMREGMALGLMVTFASSVEDVSRSSITDSIESFEEKIATLRHLEENGFDVQFLRCSLVKLLQLKSDHISYLTEKDQLKAQLLEKTASFSQIDEQLDNKKQTIANLEEELVRARLEAQKIVEEKDREDEEISRLTAADSSVREACAGAELQFQNILAELRHKSLA